MQLVLHLVPLFDGFPLDGPDFCGFVESLCLACGPHLDCGDLPSILCGFLLSSVGCFSRLPLSVLLIGVKWE